MKTNLHRRIRGFSLIEVMIAVVVLSFGLLALAALQASLFRAGAETKARANATAIAQQVVENAKTFAFLSPPTGYTGNTYLGLVTAKLDNQTVGGVAYSVCRQVRRYRHDETTKKFEALNGVDGAACTDTAAVGATLDPGTPEFKEVRVSVAWTGDAGQAKTVELTDSVAAISPADAIQVVKTPIATSRGPEVWIEPPNKDNPQVVPIAIGTDTEQKAAASSNPKPEQFVDDVSSATLFSVQTFTGDSSGSEVLLNRKIDVAAVSCVCSEGGSVSTTTNPAYQPTVWNGKQLAYMEPATAPVGKKIGNPVVSNSNKAIQTLCTTCCRDHHDAASQALKVDPYRTLVGGAHAHYGYKKQGPNYQIGSGLFPTADTAGEYVEACRLVRVNGLMRVAVDAIQNNLMVTPLNSSIPPNGFQQIDFIDRYSKFVSDYTNSAVQNIPTGYPSPTSTLPGPTTAQLSSYSDIVSPGTITLSTTGETRKTVSFGLYIDYLNADTLFAYNCARTSNNTGSCEGYGKRNPLEFIPFYAVNVANLGNNNSLGATEPVAWTSSNSGVIDVSNVVFANGSGAVTKDGGIATATSSSSNTIIAANQTINISNSGLSGTAAIDPDDAATDSYASDAQNYTKTSGPQTTTKTLIVKLGSSSLPNNVNLTVTALSGATCSGSICTFTPDATVQLRIGNFTTSKTTGKVTTISDRKVCFPTDSRISGISNPDNGTTAETAIASIGTLTSQDYTLTINVVDETTSCPGPGTSTSLVP